MCGIAGILYNYASDGAPQCGFLPNVNWEQLKEIMDRVLNTPLDLNNPPQEAVKELDEACTSLRGFAAFEQLAQSELLRQSLISYATDLELCLDNMRQLVIHSGKPATSKLVEHWNSVWVSMRDIIWTLRRDIMGNLERVKSITPENCRSNALLQAWKLTAVLENIDRLEVRGRDSLGFSIMLELPGSDSWNRIENLLREKSLHEEWERRQQDSDLGNLSLRLQKNADNTVIVIVYKVAKEVGALGDNVREIRNILRQDRILWSLLELPQMSANICSHTRWASNGIISEYNCHPVDEQVLGSSFQVGGTIFAACLNGDVDNYQELAAKLAGSRNMHISSLITTDAKIIPMQTALHYEESQNLAESFRQAVVEFEGSVAVALHASCDPQRTYLALKGSGQSLFVGLCDHGYVFASELYGIVEQTSRFIRIKGTDAVDPEHPELNGQIFIIDQRQCGLEGITACRMDGTILPLTAEDIKTAEITTRDIDMGDHSHFLLKEIFDSPHSVEKTLLGKVISNESGENAKQSVNLGPEAFPEHLYDDFKSGRVKRIMLIGQGTAAVAGNAVAYMMRTSLAGSGIQVQAIKATELSGYALEKDFSDTLVIAISQSGTTTDTNRTVDLLRSLHATVIAIVNRRNSDLVYKVDGVLYTSDGRDIEMSVASTKAFYSQVVAGYILGLRIASIMGTLTPTDIEREIQELLNLPQKMQSVLGNRALVQELARKYATTKADWAVVGSGSTKAAAEEIRIKLSELCYKSISTDFIEDKKHIDLSSEPLTLVCTAGLPLMALRDCVKEIAIFKSHKSIPIVVASKGFDDFEQYATGVIYVPSASANASVLLNTMVGHLWGYYCALTINAYADRLRVGRSLGVAHLTSKGGLVLTQANMKRMLSIGKAFHDDLKNGRLNSSLRVDAAVRLSMMFQYFTDARSLRQFTVDFKGNDLVETMVAVLSRAIAELSRPIDAIKHQAKTITVGISRAAEFCSGPIFEALRDLSVEPEDLPYRDLNMVKALSMAVSSVVGATVYTIQGLNALNETNANTRIKVIRKTGLAQELRSRSDEFTALVGTKEWVVNNKRTYVGHGRNDGRPLVMLPVFHYGHVDSLVLLHVRFKSEMPLPERVEVIKNLTNRYGDLKSQVEETNLIWHDEYLNLLQVEELSTLRAAELTELILHRKREQQ